GKLASSSWSPCAFLSRFLAHVQSPSFTAPFDSSRNEFTFEAKSAWTGFSLWPFVADKFCCATDMLSFICCCAAATSCCESWGASEGGSVFALPAGSGVICAGDLGRNGWRTTTRAGGGATSQGNCGAESSADGG